MTDYAVINPATGETLATYPTITDEALETVLEKADAAYRTWRDTPVAERAALIRRAAELHRERRDELAAIRRAADAAPGPSSALAAAVTTVAVHVVTHRKLSWGILAEPVEVDVTESRLASRREIAGEIELRIGAAVRAGHLPAQDTALAATALLGALHESLVGPLAPENLDDAAKLRDAVQTVTLLALRAVGVMDARARGLVVQAVLPAKALVGA